MPKGKHKKVKIRRKKTSQPSPKKMDEMMGQRVPK